MAADTHVLGDLGEVCEACGVEHHPLEQSLSLRGRRFGALEGVADDDVRQAVDEVPRDVAGRELVGDGAW